jgi:hypothetical protein
MSEDNDDLFHDDDDLFIDVPVSWLAIRTTDIDAVANALHLQNTRIGNYSGWGYDNPPNTFLYVARNEWVIVYHQWEYTGQLELGATNEDYDRAVYAANVALLDRLSNRFGEAQSFGFEEDHVFRANWALSKNGKLERYFQQSSEEPDRTINIGDPTEAENFIDWDTLNDWELGDAFGCTEVLRIARQWSFNPISNEDQRDPSGVLGDGQISIV